MNDNFFQINLNCNLKNKLDVYSFVADESHSNHKKELIEGFLRRERVGNLCIAEQVILPHAEGDYIENSQIFFITFKDTIEWDEDTGTVKLAIILLIKNDETKEVKKKISLFIRKLADEEYIERLFLEKHPESVVKIIENNWRNE